MARPRSAWVVAVAALAVILVATGAAIAAGLRDGSGHEPARPTTGPLPTPPTPGARGFDGPTRQVSWRGVAVDVPADWPDDTGPGPDWCASDDGRGGSLYPTRPYVAVDRTYAMTLSIGCPEGGGAPDAFGSAPERLWAPHLAFELPIGHLPDGTLTHRGWTFSTRTVAGVRVTLLTDAATRDLVDPILDSIRPVDTDAHGCDSTSPVQAREFVRPEPAFDVTDVDRVDAISICQYDRGSGTSAPGLLGSRRLEGAPAQSLLDAVRVAPAGGGPDAPQHCVHDMYGDTALTIRLHTGGTTRDLYAYYEWCFGNGIDDGTTRRELTRGDCLPLWGDRVTLWGGSAESFRRCHDPR
ncbi:hypothetical protein [Nocardioides sp.]|uniref:hypothetical protein n=1 Tax=Nocardioides sp. TaxID=35761 RepID=UPI0025F8F261|nr:hypothetical protein [Nocardioides sp.]